MGPKTNMNSNGIEVRLISYFTLWTSRDRTTSGSQLS